MSEHPQQDLVDGLWARLRNVLIALDRVDRLETSVEFSDWIQALQRDDAQMHATARSWVLRVLSVAADPLNYQLLLSLRTDSQTISQLMQTAGVTRVELTERIKDLAQIGLLSQAMETSDVQNTSAGDAIVAWIESLNAGVANHMRDGLMKDNPTPKMHRVPAQLGGGQV